jgi:predicted nucleic acid-binding protein
LTRFLYDTAVFAYALGREHRYREPCRWIVEQAGQERLQGEASADLIQELLHQRTRSTGDRGLAARQARQVAALCALHEVRPDDVRRAIGLFESSQRLSARDCVFAALALNRGIAVILSPDDDFDEVEGLRRIDPTDRAGIDALVPS